MSSLLRCLRDKLKGHGSGGSASAATYQYSALKKPKSIRLIKLRSGKFEDRIECDIVTANLTQNPSYTALSYVWGDLSEMISIFCNGAPMMVTANLAAALRRLRHAAEVRVVWIDAICINQADDKERSQQVRMMNDIYSSARQVAIYVGENADDTGLAIDIMSRLFNMSKNTVRAPGMIVSSYSDFGAMANLPPKHSPDWVALENFYNRPWFGRVWVVQEAVLSPRDPIVLCGARQLSWAIVGIAAQFFHESGYDSGARGGVTSMIPGERSLPPTLMTSRRKWSYHAALIEQYRTALHSSGEYSKLSLLNLLRDTRNFEATDPRDKIFALYGIGKGLHEQDENRNTLSLFQPDYTKPVDHVYREFTRILITHTKCLDILSLGGNHATNKIRNLPSWVPDLSTPLDANPLGTKFIKRCYQASADFVAILEPSNEPNSLIVGSTLVDLVEKVAAPLEEQDLDLLPESRQPGALKRQWDDLASHLGDQYRGEPLTDAFWKTLIANVGKTGRRVSEESYENYDLHFLAYWRLCRLADQKAEDYMKEHSSRPDPSDAVARIRTQERAREEEFLCEVEVNELGRRVDQLMTAYRDKLSPEARADPQIRDKIACNILQRDGLPPVRADDPSAQIRNDRFINAYFERLKAEELSLQAPNAGLYGHLFSSASLGRRFFTTKAGKMGIGPRDTQPGDYLAIVSGAPVPFIFRSRDSPGGAASRFPCCSVVGEAYAHAVMDGDYVDHDGEGGASWLMVNLV